MSELEDWTLSDIHALVRENVKMRGEIEGLRANGGPLAKAAGLSDDPALREHGEWIERREIVETNKRLAEENHRLKKENALLISKLSQSNEVLSKVQSFLDAQKIQ
jgi:hypothetical protein